MKEKLMEALKQTKDDADYIIYYFTEEGTFSNKHQFTPYVRELVEKATEIKIHPDFEDIVMVADRIGISRKDFAYNISYETKDTEGFEEHTNKFEKAHNVFIKLDRENKLITFKLAEKEKTMQILERTDYVCNPYKGKYIRCVDIDGIVKHMKDEFFNPYMVKLGRKVLGFPDYVV
jgi:hypothetical protein